MLAVAICGWFAGLSVLRLEHRLGLFPQPVRVRWAPSTSESQRRAAEQALTLLDGEEVAPATWTYHLGDHARETIRRIVMDPRIEDTHHIDRQAFRVVLDLPRVPALIRRALEAGLGLPLALVLCAGGSIALWVAMGLHRRGLAEHLARVRERSWLLPRLGLVGALQVAIALWVPITPSVAPDYLQTNLFEEVRPRALVGTVWQYFDLSAEWFLVSTQAALFVWLALVALLLDARGDEAPPRSLNLRAMGLTFLFGFSTLAFLTNAFSGYVDIYAEVAVVAGVWALHGRQPSSWQALGWFLFTLAIATWIHEKSVFEAGILLLWVIYTRSRRQAFVAVATYAASLGIYALLTSGTRAPAGGLELVEYLDLATRSGDFLTHRSLNVFGVLIGGGLLWVLYVRMAVRFVRVQTPARGRFVPSALAVGMALLCLAPLLIAWDTNRLVSIVWLPTLLLVIETSRGPIRETTGRARVLILAACVLQGLIPPVLVLRHQAIPLNCYALNVVGQFDRVQQAAAWPVPDGFTALTLRLNPEYPRAIDLTRCVAWQEP